MCLYSCIAEHEQVLWTLLQKGAFCAYDFKELGSKCVGHFVDGEWTLTNRHKRRNPQETAPAQPAETPPRRTRDPFAIAPARPRVERTGADATPLPNPRHELFAQAIAAGSERSDAYDAAGYGSSNSYRGATQLLARADVSNRIMTLQGRAAERVAVTIETLVDELEDARLLAKAHDQPASMVAATREKAVLLGLRIEKRDVSVREGDPKGLTDDELADIARGRSDGTAAAKGDPAKPSRLVH